MDDFALFSLVKGIGMACDLHWQIRGSRGGGRARGRGYWRGQNFRGGRVDQHGMRNGGFRGRSFGANVRGRGAVNAQHARGQSNPGHGGGRHVNVQNPGVACNGLGSGSNSEKVVSQRGRGGPNWRTRHERNAFKRERKQIEHEEMKSSSSSGNAVYESNLTEECHDGSLDEEIEKCSNELGKVNVSRV